MTLILLYLIFHIGWGTMRGVYSLAHCCTRRQPSEKKFIIAGHLPEATVEDIGHRLNDQDEEAMVNDNEQEIPDDLPAVLPAYDDTAVAMEGPTYQTY